MRRTLAILVALCIITSVSCYSPAYFPVVHRDLQTGTVYDINYYEHPPSYIGKSTDWHCIRYYVSCYGGAPMAAEYTWTPNGPIRIECTFLKVQDYFNAQKMVTCADNTVVAGLTYRPHPFTIVWLPKDPIVREGLELVWRQLGTYDYYEALGLDGCSFSIEAYSRQGILRRMVWESSEYPQYGSDITAVLSGIMAVAIKASVNREFYESAFDKECDVSGKSAYKSANDVLQELRQVVSASATNEIKVKEYKRPPCEPHLVPSYPNIDDYFKRTAGCLIIPQPLGQKEYPKP